TNVNEMWGGAHSEAALHNDALINAKKLVGQPNLYVSNASGLIGKHDVLSSERVDGNLSDSMTVAVEGGVIEAATNGCTHDLDVKLRSLGKKDAKFKFRNTGTHQWGYWQDDLRDYLPVLEEAFGSQRSRELRTHTARPCRGPGLMHSRRCGHDARTEHRHYLRRRRGLPAQL